MKRGEIYLLDLKEPLGNIQAGIRPVVVIQNDTGNQHSTTTIVSCLTTRRKKYLPTHTLLRVGGLKPSLMLGEQIFTVNQVDLIQKIGTITDNSTLERLDRCIRVSLGI